MAEPVSTFFWVMVMTKMECDLDDSWFMLVAATALAFPPLLMTSYTSWTLETYISSRPLTYTPLFFSSCTGRLSFCGARRSRIRSM